MRPLPSFFNTADFDVFDARTAALQDPRPHPTEPQLVRDRRTRAADDLVPAETQCAAIAGRAKGSADRRPGVARAGDSDPV
jgi:hypothetical protein